MLRNFTSAPSISERSDYVIGSVEAPLSSRWHLCGSAPVPIKSRRRRKVSSFAEIRRRWKRFSGPIGVKVYGPKEELCEELQKVVEAAGAAEIIDGGELWDLCGQRSKEEGAVVTPPSFLLLSRSLPCPKRKSLRHLLNR